MYLWTVFSLSPFSVSFFSTAGRSIKTGLTASVIVSQWTWAATLLQSSNVAWAYGVSGPFW
jgi:Na+/proline symporter